jgi:hypothetical protein
VNYSLFMMMVVILERLEKRPRVTPIAFPPPIFTGIASVSVFCVSLPPPHENALGGLYIVVVSKN